MKTANSMLQIQARAELERMVYNYALLGIIDNGVATGIVSFIGNMIRGGEPPRRESNIIYFPAPAEMQAPDPAEHPASYEEPRLSFAAHCEAFEGVDFGGNPTGGRILWALYHNRIHSIEELARTPATNLLDCRRIGQKTLGRIRAALESKGISSEAWGISERAVTQQKKYRWADAKKQANNRRPGKGGTSFTGE
jgi:hypothetical protein